MDLARIAVVLQICLPLKAVSLVLEYDTFIQRHSNAAVRVTRIAIKSAGL